MIKYLLPLLLLSTPVMAATADLKVQAEVIRLTTTEEIMDACGEGYAIACAMIYPAAGEYEEAQKDVTLEDKAQTRAEMEVIYE